ncbi:secondary thiamine-phosphate synthase enzyme YjbQ [Synechococcus elongatus IITB7]|uniref:secondary thiamine-phosphate synthase enzyme YjbQ n=1 Tax=Synechococcus elongatus TaxID=32046 RepID=UPI0030D1E72B
MAQYQQILQLQSQGQGFLNITGAIARIVRESQIQTGICHLFVRHTSASLIIQENADPDVLHDLTGYFEALVPEAGYESLGGSRRFRSYAHSAEGPDDMPAHIRTVLTRTSEQIPIVEGRLGLGTWQAIYLWEHRDRPHSRQVIVHLMGD